MTPSDQPAALIRAARREDSPSIGRLYRRVYGPDDRGEAAIPYPFPQFFDADWVARAVSHDNVVWIVADIDGDVVGAVGALRNIGDPDDRVAEAFGLVVEPPSRGRGVAKGLFESLRRHLRGDAHFIIAETRTADSGGWLVVRGGGFSPMGFEPFAHVMPVGPESMLLLGEVSDQAIRGRRAPDRLTERSRGLARLVLEDLAIPAPASPPPDLDPTGRAGPDARPIATGPIGDRALPEGLSADRPLLVVRDDPAGARLLGGWRGGGLHASGVVCLRRLEGTDRDGSRYDPRYYVGRLGGAEMGAVRLVWDRLDGRIRILDLKVRVEGLQGPMIASVVEELRRQAGPLPLVIVIDVVASHPAMQATLERLGFTPTVYYVSLVAWEGARADAIQYTILFNRSLVESASTMERLAWPEARAVIAQVTGVPDPGPTEAPAPAPAR